jgi:ubiquitin carboxyl-terminal hydrolase 9/24
MSKIKVNDRCDFPMELDMQEYSQAKISRDDLIKKMEKESWTKEDLTEDQLIVLNREIAPEYFKYKLKGVVVHDGMADYGHYYSFIKDREGSEDGENWYCFNDTIVS